MTSTMRDNAEKPERTVDEAVQILWKVIEEAKMFLADERSTPEEKRRWSKVLCDTIAVLNKVLASKGEKPLEDEDLGTLLQKVPRRLQLTILKGVKKWRKKNF
jgi:hypothetical protein